jgi:hypothetical protein
MLTTNPIAFTYRSLTNDLGTHRVVADFPSVESTLCGLVSRIETRLFYLANMGRTIKGVTVTDAKAAACEIRGMIDALSAICDAPTLKSELLDGLAAARTEALDRLRK